jgi:hypothetical protein
MSVARILGAVGLRLPVFGSGRAGAVPAAGQNPSASLSLREDGTWAAASGGGTPAVSVTDETTYGIAPAVGTGTNYARQDHTHGSPTAPTASSVGALGAQAAASGDLGGTYPSPTVTQARGLRTTTGPTTLVVGAVADGQLLQRVGATVVGVWLSAAFSFAGGAEVESPSVLTVPGVVTTAGVVA